MSRNLWLLVAVAVIAGGVVGALLIPASSPAPSSPGDEAPAQVPPTQVPPAAPEPRPAPAEEQPDAAAAAGMPPAWRRVDPALVDADERPTHREAVTGRVLVRIATNLSVLNVGERFALPVPQADAVFEARIEQVHPGLGGARAFTGSLASAGGGRFVLTVGPRSTFANISIPGGRYELVGNRRYAWLMPSANMDRDVDYSVPDYHPRASLPPEPERRPG